MSRETFSAALAKDFGGALPFPADGNFVSLAKESAHDNQNSTNDAFSKKWEDYKNSQEKDALYAMQRDWYLKLYGFESEKDLAAYLQSKKYIYDAGCGLGYKAAWFAELAPQSIVIGMDFSAAARSAAQAYAHLPNLFFVQGDIAAPIFGENSIDYVSCDQVIMHTEYPEKTFAELARITKKDGEFACYFYAKKALPRELLDDYFRVHCKNMSHDDLMVMSKQLTELGKRLSELNVKVDVPEIPALGIKGGLIDVQRFIYWNFLKCYWNGDLGRETSDIVNFDWYSPSNAKRYSEQEVKELVQKNDLAIHYFHAEEACYSGRFLKR